MGTNGVVEKSNRRCGKLYPLDWATEPLCSVHSGGRMADRAGRPCKEGPKAAYSETVLLDPVDEFQLVPPVPPVSGDDLSHDDDFATRPPAPASASTSPSLSDSKSFGSRAWGEVRPPVHRLSNLTDHLKYDRLYATYLPNFASPEVPSRTLRTDAVLERVFVHVPISDRLRCSVVCRQWRRIVWTPVLWRTLTFHGDQPYLAGRLLVFVLDKLSSYSSLGCLQVRKVEVAWSSTISGTCLENLACRCPELTSLRLHHCVGLTGQGVRCVIDSCPNLNDLRLCGCTSLSSPERLTAQASMHGLPSLGVYSNLEKVDFSDSGWLNDYELSRCAKMLPGLKSIYLRRCLKLTDDGVERLASLCNQLVEISITDCGGVSDRGLIALGKNCSNLKYISTANCTITDRGLLCLAANCASLHYVNLHKCTKLTDHGLSFLIRHTSRLSYLDLGGCPSVTDITLHHLAAFCPRLKRLNVSGCTLLSDSGIRRLATLCRRLTYINLLGCSFAIETLLYILQRNPKTLIEHDQVDIC